jgi:hypothetical protein
LLDHFWKTAGKLENFFAGAVLTHVNLLDVTLGKWQSFKKVADAIV